MEKRARGLSASRAFEENIDLHMVGYQLPLYESGLDMADFPVFRYSMRDVVKAGDALRGPIAWSEEAEPEILRIFQIASSWRDSHAFPMRSLRQQTSAKMRRLGIGGITAARLKRMGSIRRKLRAISANLNQIQDLGGCRAILPSIADANALIDALKADTRHELIREDDYINRPKQDGYRSYHLVFKFRASMGEEAFKNRRVEVQIRTRLQHSWATAVEAVGLFRQEDMKAGQGDPDWLRLFRLMSAELAIAEGCSEANGVPPRSERVLEIKEIANRIQAVSTLQKLRDAVRYSGRPQNYREKPKYYRIEYNNKNRTVEVKDHIAPLDAVSSLERAERKDNMRDEDEINTVLVEADKIESLKIAYPNYFGDVNYFSTNLHNIVSGRPAVEYTAPPVVSAPRKKKAAMSDLTWLRPGRHRRWNE